MDQRLRAIAACGADRAVVIRFTRAFSLTRPSDFVGSILVRRLGASHVTVGYDFRFGRDGRGDAQFLLESGKRLGFGVTIIPPVMHKGEPISSTRIRRLVSMGRVASATRLLGRPFAIEGRTTKGRGLGTRLGFPTINILPANELLPPPGVYVARFGPGRLPGVANIGFRPTVEHRARPPLLEVHLLGSVPRRIPPRVETGLLGFIRPERRFRSLDALKTRISCDVRLARASLGLPRHLTRKRPGR
jgi:riboflavin kinase/FMN adenylyltransferase